MKDNKDVKATGPPVLANSLINFINRSHKKVLGTGWKLAGRKINCKAIIFFNGSRN